MVDLSEKCIEACRKGFASSSHISSHANDGKSLGMIAEKSIDFVFSFDSLAHAEADVIEAYLVQLATKQGVLGHESFHSIIKAQVEMSLRSYSTKSTLKKTVSYIGVV